MADGEGFEPPKVLFHTLSDFKSDAFNRSANHPEKYDTWCIAVNILYYFFQKRKYFKTCAGEIHKQTACADTVPDPIA